jgi:hypothetical protein
VAPRLNGRAAAAVVTAVVLVLIALDASDARLRHWWTGRPLTTNVVGGLLVLLLTLLVVDQLIRRRQVRERSRALAAQVVILLGQAGRATSAVGDLLDGAGDREAAGDEVRTYVMMLLVAAPLLIDTVVSRAFLEQAQRLAGELARALAALSRTSDPTTISADRLHAAEAELRTASKPLVQVLDVEGFMAADAEGDG